MQTLFSTSLTLTCHKISQIPLYKTPKFPLSNTINLNFSIQKLKASSMAERAQLHQLQVYPQRQYDTKKGPSASTVLAILTLVPIGGTLLALSGITLAGTVIGLAITTPLFVLFSPVLVPGAIMIGLAVAAFLAAGAFGTTAVASLSWFVGYLREAAGKMPGQKTKDVATQKMKDVGQEGKKGLIYS